MGAVMVGTVRKMMTLVVVVVVVASVCADACNVCGTTPVYKPPKPPTIGGTPKTPKSSFPKTPSVPKTCPVSVAKLGVCTPLLGGLLGGLLPPGGQDCCALLGLLGLDVELCLCLALDANVLGLISLDAHVGVVASILTSCGLPVPPNLSCPF